MRKLLTFICSLVACLGIGGQAYAQGTAPGFDPVMGVGATMSVRPGSLYCAGTSSQYPGGSFSLVNNTTNYVYIDTTTGNCTVGVKQTSLVATDIPIAQVVVNNNVIVGFRDIRPRFWSAGSTNASYPGVSSNGTGLSMTGPVAAQNLAVSVLSFGAKCDGVTDDTSAFSAAWASINTAGGEIDLPASTCYVPNGVQFNQTNPNSNTTRIIRGLGVWQSKILTHNANIGMELGGAVGVVLKDFTLQDNGTTAAVGLMRYRTDWTQGYAGQCGSHNYDNIAVNGNYSIAAMYSIGCEVNDHRNLSLINGGAGTALAIAQNNCLGMTGMTMPINAVGASDTVNHFYGGGIFYYGTGSGSAVYFCNGSADDVTFHGTYFVANSPGAIIVFGGSGNDNVQGTKSFHSVRFEGSGDAFAINAGSVGPLTVDSGSTFGETTPGIDIHQVNTTWAGGSDGLIQADIHGNSLSGRGVTLGNIQGSNINILGDGFTLLNNSVISESHIEANSFTMPGNFNVLGSVLTQNDDSTSNTGGLKVYYGPWIWSGSSGYGSVLVSNPFQGVPINPVNGELAMADGVHWQPNGITSQTLVQYVSATSSWVPVGVYKGPAPTTSAGTLTGSNTGGYITGLSAASSVSITFTNSGWNTWASCIWTPDATGGAGQNSSTPGLKTGATYTFTAAYTGGINYSCNGN